MADFDDGAGADEAGFGGWGDPFCEGAGDSDLAGEALKTGTVGVLVPCSVESGNYGDRFGCYYVDCTENEVEIPYLENGF